MVENRPFLTWLSHAVVLLGVIVIAFPIWMTFVASTHDQATMLRSPAAGSSSAPRQDARVEVLVH